jgi:hypothetical protein
VLLVALAGCGLVIAASMYVAFSQPFPLAENCTRRLTGWIGALGVRPSRTIVTGEAFLLAMSLATGASLVAAWLAARVRGPVATVLVLGMPALFVAVLLPGYPVLSNDIFKYVFDGRIITVYGGNPFVDVPADFPDDRFYDLVYWKAVVSAHGPLWRWAQAASASVGGESCRLAISSMKYWAVVGYILTLGVGFVVARRLRPGAALGGVVLYGWSPLVLVETIQNGHNDVVAALFCLLAVVAVVGRRPGVGFPLLAIAFLVKPLAAILGLVLLIASRSQPRRLVLGVGLATAIVVAGYAPFWEGLVTLQGMSREELLTASPAEALFRALVGVGVGEAVALRSSAFVATATFAIAAVGIALGYFVGRVDLPGAAAATFLAYAALGAQWFNPWYLLWLAAFLPLVTSRHVLITGVVFLSLAPLVYLVQYSPLPSFVLVFLPVWLVAAYSIRPRRAA